MSKTLNLINSLIIAIITPIFADCNGAYMDALLLKYGEDSLYGWGVIACSNLANGRLRSAFDVTRFPW